ncbi:MAG: hypothetical protein GY910_21050, partial [bacterium]|nr:hypothetical protein [bacterium]
MGEAITDLRPAGKIRIDSERIDAVSEGEFISSGASVKIIEESYDSIALEGCRPLTLGGDHTVALPILRAMARRYGPLGVIHVDAHADVNDHMFGEPIAHGTPFRRAIEEGLLDPERTVQIGIRGALYSDSDKEWGLDQGIRVIEIEEYNDLGIEAVI